MEAYLMLGVMVLVLTGISLCSGELNDDRSGNRDITESDYLTLKLRVTEHDVKYERLLNKILSQNVKISEQASDLQLMKTEQGRKFSEIDTYISEQRRLRSDIQTIENRTDELRIHLDSLHEEKENLTFRSKTIPKDCQEILQDGGSYGDGVYDIQPSGVNQAIKVYCDMTTDGGGWTVFQRRYDGSVDFFRTWSEYKTGFGDIAGEFWLGNENIHRITFHERYKLRINLEDFSGNRRFAEYSSFVVWNEDNKYQLFTGSYSGTAGYDELGWHNKMKFTTKDADNDEHRSANCASTYRGAWWYKACHHANLNGLYYNGQKTDPKYNTWYRYRMTSGHKSMKSTAMMIRKA